MRILDWLAAAALVSLVGACEDPEKEKAKIAELQRKADERIAKIEGETAEKLAAAERKLGELQGQLVEAGVQAKAEADEELAKAKTEADKLTAEANAALKKARAAYKESERRELALLTKELDELKAKAQKAEPKVKAQVDQALKDIATKKEAVRKDIDALDSTTLETLRTAKAKAVSRKGVVPQGYVSKPTARAACEAAGKRLCQLAEWKLACRGDQDTRFPYGASYRAGACNVHQRHHAAAILWGDASLGHWDPRLNQLPVEGSPLLRTTGETATCRSAWGDDAVYDMVGNLDEWVDDPSTKGTFVGGFYARDTVRGCDAKVTQHPGVFFDFSTGVRCCSDPRP